MPAEFAPNAGKANLVKSSYSLNFIFACVCRVFHKIIKSCLKLLTGHTAIERVLKQYDKKSLENSNENGITSVDRADLAIKLFNILENSKFKDLSSAATYLNDHKGSRYTCVDEVVLAIENLKICKYSKNLVVSNKIGVEARLSSETNVTSSTNPEKVGLDSSQLLLDDKTNKLKKSVSPPSQSNLKSLKSLIITCNHFAYFKKIIRNYQKERYNSENQIHEEKLLKIWNLSSIEDKPIENRISKEWQYLGFQGTDPATDFRGMGRLGLECMLYFVENYKEAKNFILKSNHKITGFPFAMLCINMTALLCELLENGNPRLKMYVYRTYGIINDDDNFNGHDFIKDHGDFIEPVFSETHVLEVFSKIFTRLLLDFKENHWIIKKELDVLNFNKVRESYKKLIMVEGRDCVFLRKNTVMLLS